MTTTAQKAIDVFERLGESAQISVLKFAEFLAAESDNDVALYDDKYIINALKEAEERAKDPNTKWYSGEEVHTKILNRKNKNHV